MADELHFDLSKHPLTQIDEDTSIKWDQLTHDEQVWLYQNLLGRDPVPGEVQNQIDMGKSIKYFVHGTREELKTRKDNGDTGAQNALKNLNGWEQSIESTFMGSIADLTGIKEIEDPFGFIADEIGVKEVEEWGGVALQVAGSVFGGPLGTVAASMFNAGIHGDFGDVLEEGVTSAVKQYLPTTSLKAAFEVGHGLYEGQDIEDALLDGAFEYLGGAIDANTTDYLPVISNRSLFEAAAKYAVDGDPKAAFQMAAVNAAARAAYEAKNGAVPDKDFQGSFLEWMQQDFENSVTALQSGKMAFSENLSDVGLKIASRLKLATPRPTPQQTTDFATTAADASEAPRVPASLATRAALVQDELYGSDGSLTINRNRLLDPLFEERESGGSLTILQ